MGLFDSPEEKERKAKLKALEDKRLAFAQSLNADGKVPAKVMLFAREGGFVGVGRYPDGHYLYLEGPGPNETEGTFFAQEHLHADVSTEEQMVASQGMGGVLGFGKKGGIGFKLHIHFDDGDYRVISFLTHENSVWESATNKKACPLFTTKRRKSDANVVWDFAMIEPRNAEEMHSRTMAFFA